MDFLFHVVPVAALVRAVAVLPHAHGGAHHRSALGAPDVDALRRKIDQIALLQIDEAVGDRAQRQRIRGDEVLADAYADHQRAAGPGGDDAVRVVLADDAQRVGAVQALHGLGDGLEQVAFFVQGAVDEVGDDFGIGARLEAVAAGFEFVAQFFVVLDDAVVNQADAPPGEMRVGVLHRWPAMRRPARVGDSGGAVDGFGAQILR